MVVLDIFWHLQNFESGKTFMKSKHRTSRFTYLEITGSFLDEISRWNKLMIKFEQILLYHNEHKIWEIYIHWSHLGLEAQYRAGGLDDSRKQGSRLDAHSIFCMKFFEGTYYGFAYLIVISCYILSKKKDLKFRWGNCRVDFYFAWSSNFANGLIVCRKK